MADCIFCKIVSGEIPADIVYQDKEVIAFSDIKPIMPHHYLIIPKQHFASVNDADEDNQALYGRLFVAAANIAKARGFDGAGYRAVVNTNAHAGQEVFHVHMHLFAGKAMGWPPF